LSNLATSRNIFLSSSFLLGITVLNHGVSMEML
jgi:hypothetical protein